MAGTQTGGSRTRATEAETGWPPEAPSTRGRVPRWPTRALPLVAIITGVILVLSFAGLIRLLPGLHNPFSERDVDRSQPVILQSIQDLSRYEAAAGNFQVVIDLEKDARFLPSVVRGQRTLFVAAGTVATYVDFSQIGDGAVEVSDDRRSVAITLPAPALDKTNLDSERSYVFAQQRGILDRIGSLFSGNTSNQQQLYVMAEQKIQTAAKDSGLIERAEKNTRAMLVGMLGSLGFTNVTVNFAPPQP
jgi:hypothetical protein